MKKFRIVLASIIAVGIFGVFAHWFMPVERIDAGSVGIKVNLVGAERGVADITECSGWVVYMPLFTEIHEFPIYTQVKDYEPFTINAKDGSEFSVDPTLSYKVNPEKVPSIFRSFRKGLPDLENGYIRNVIMDCYRNVANRYLSDSLISHRPQFETAVQTMIISQLHKEGFELQQLTSNLNAPKSLKDAIDAKNITTQEAIQSENRLRKAEAEAKAKIIEAEAEKKANDLKASALTPLIIQQMYIEKWDGKLPTYGQVPQIFQNITK